MPQNSLVHRMTTYMAWGNDVVLNNAAQLPDVELMEPRDALFDSIAGTFDHILLIEEIFQAHLEDRSHPHTSRKRAEELSFDEVAMRLRAMDQYYVDLSIKWTAEDLAEIIEFEYVGGGAGAMTREDILLHLSNHATYHRGFVSTLMYPFKLNGAANDLTVFMRDA
jgi:uncharacterized damage-inducible protein DinB